MVWVHSQRWSRGLTWRRLGCSEQEEGGSWRGSTAPTPERGGLSAGQSRQLPVAVHPACQIQSGYIYWALQGGVSYLATAHRTLPAMYLFRVLQGDIQGSAPAVVSEEVLALARDHDCVLVEISAAGLGSDTLPVR